MYTNIQILMNVRLVQTTVIKSVPTLKAPSPVPVTVDIHCQVMEDHALVCMYIYHNFTKMLKDIGIIVPKSIEARSKFSMHANKGRG